jgi:hypothetical protein
VPGTAQQTSKTFHEWPDKQDVFLAILLWGGIAVALALLARGLPARTFFVGDPGVKLIAAMNAIRHPTRPLDIDLPRVGGRPVELVDPFFSVHGDHAHATTSELFPLISAPLIAAFGIRGAFILPALGFLLMLAATAWLGRTLDQKRSLTILILVTAASTPLLFYALEFWEHSMAVGIGALATALFVRQPRSDRMLLTSGALLGVAVQLRPEAVWYGAALMLGSQMLPTRFSLRNLAAVIVGVVVVQLPFMTHSALHSGHVLSGHVTSNLSGITGDWFVTRLAILRTWFVPGSLLLIVTCILTVALTFAATVVPVGTHVFRMISASLGIIVVAAAVRRAFPPASVWCAAPITVLSLGVPFLRERHERSFLFTVAFASSLLVVLTAPNDGGGQWGPRYLLFMFIPVAILTADALKAIVRSSRFVGAGVTAVLIVASLLVQRNAYKELRGTKRTYERFVEFVERQTPPGGYIVTDLWWLDQVTAGLYPTRVVLFADSGASAHRALALLAAAKAQNVTVVRSEQESPNGPFGQWFDKTGWFPKARADTPDRALTAYEMRQTFP